MFPVIREPASTAEIETKRKAFLREWRLRCQVVRAFAPHGQPARDCRGVSREYCCERLTILLGDMTEKW